MPEPIADPDAQRQEIKRIETILGDQNNSLYEVFSRSAAVNDFVSEILSGSQPDAFSDMGAANETLDRLISMVNAEVAQKRDGSQRSGTAPAPDKQREAGEINIVPGQQDGALSV